MSAITFEEAVRLRRAQRRLLIVTDVGEFEAPPDIALRYRLAKQRGDGRLDRRTKEGKALYAWEREFCAAKLKEWANA